ncbi:MAG: gamma carbonic anhydrase family protein [Burkholderiales bacterium]|nr:gamma carbonic anhydrase family protein [Burkholderiales bacterium]
MPVFRVGERRVEFRGARHFVAWNATLAGAIVLEEDASVWFGAVLRADNERIHVGPRSNIQDGAVLHVDPGFPLTLGAGVSVGHKAMLHGCTVGDGALVGINAVVLNGARIGAGALVGANALVPEGREIPPGVLALGSPARVVRELRPEERLRLAQVAESYVERAAFYRARLREEPLPPSAR